MDTKLSILTEQQRTAFTLREQGQNYQAIGEAMGCSAGTAAAYYRLAAGRLRAYEIYHHPARRSGEPVEFPLTRGELRLIQSGLRLLCAAQEQGTHRSAKTDWQSRLPYEHQLVQALAKRAAKALEE